jgi:RNA polymerase sigma factor (sigma-70 family)
MELVEAHFSLARSVAREFTNIPGLALDEIEARALETLGDAARGFDPARGSNFEAYASTAIRNALRSLYQRQVRHYRHHQYVLDQPAGVDSTQADAIHNVPDPSGHSVGTQVHREECMRILNELVAKLPERSRLVAVAISEGNSYSAIGAKLGISKQAVHKIAVAAIQNLRDELEKRGFHDVDTIGMLASTHRS